MKQECAITRDLLPLYLEGLAGPESAAFVRRHLEQCPDCRAEQERLSRETPREPELPVKRLRKLLLREKYVRLLAAVLAALAVAAAVFSRLSAPEYLSAGQAAPETAAVGDALCIVFSPAVRHVSCVSWTDETGAPVYQLEAWTTLLDGGEPQAGYQSVTLPRQEGMIVFYAQNNGQDDALLYGTAADAGGWALPRLALNYYGAAAAVLAAVLALAAVVVKPLRYRFLQGLTLPTGWLLATLLVKGKSWASYALPRDLSMIALTAMALWALLLLLLKWQRQKPPAEI